MLDGPGEFVTLTLTTAPDDRGTLFYKYQGAKASLKLNHPTTVPWGHMTHLLGDPYYRERDRELAYNNLCRRAGVLPGQDLPYAITAEDQDGDRIATIVDDPEGVDAPTASKADGLDPTAIRQALINMQRRQSDLERQLAVYEAQKAADVEKSDLPSPTAKKRAARAKTTVTRTAEAPVPTIPAPGDDMDTNPLIPEDSPTVLPVN